MNPTFGPLVDSAPDFNVRLRRYRIGMITALIPVLMLFLGFTSAYVLRQGATSLDAATGTQMRDWQSLQIPVVLWLNTLLLAASSATIELARRRLHRQFAIAPAQAVLGHTRDTERPLPWLGVTAILGSGFVIGQWLAWRDLAAQNIYLASNPSSSFFYLLTGTHAVHLAGGVLALLYAAATSLLRKPMETRGLVVEVTALYWHFMGLLWLYIFALLLLAK
jgi:cytochrome c oxidase subunit 3